MFFSKLLKSFGVSPANSGSRTRRPTTFRPRIELLESRQLLSATYFVDDDLVQNPNADFTTIQAAVDFAAAGDTIEVAAGTYEEAVNVDKTLTIAGPQDHRRARTRSSDPTREAIVDTPATGLAGFNLTADDIEIRGFTIQDRLGPAGLPNSGIMTSTLASGYQILDNRIQFNTLGLELESNGSKRTLVQGNYFNDNNEVGLNTGHGILSDQGISDVHVRRNYLTQQDTASMKFDGASKLVLTGNQLVDDAPLILANTTDSEVNSTHGRRSNGDGLVLDNVSDVDVRFNHFHQSLGSGMKLTDSDTLLVEWNILNKNDEDGISLVNTDTSTVRTNYLFANDRDGIRVNATSEDNTFTSNKSRRNGEHDYHDDSTGGQTAGTANTWQFNKGKTQNRVGLIG